MSRSGHIRLRDVHKFFGEEHVLQGVSLDIAEGELVVLVGPSGCGKSTLLRVLAGLEGVTTGTVEIGGVDMTALGAAERGLAMVFQSYALYPHMSVRENIGFGLKIAGQTAADRTATVDQAAQMLQLDALLDRKPKELSGGQRQRVAIGRAIVRDPAAFLFDEPLSNLDAALRVQMRLELAQLHQSLGKTMVYVTHDQVEAMTLADRIVVLSGGVIQQIGSPMELYRSPANLFVATFIGSPKMNVLPCTGSGAGVKLDNGAEILVGGGSGATHLGIRCEHIAVVEGASAAGSMSGKVLVVEHLGSESYLYVDVGSSSAITVRSAADITAKPNESIGLQLDLAQAFLFDGAGERITT